MKPTSAFGIVLAAGLAVGAPAFAQQTVKIGSVLSITGPASFLGEPEDKTLRIYVDKINAAGGVNGYTFKIDARDDNATPSQTVSAVRDLWENDKVFAPASPPVRTVRASVSISGDQLERPSRSILSVMRG